MDYLSTFTEMLQARNLTPNTIRSYTTYIKPYLQFLSSMCIRPEDASWQVARDFLRWLQKERSLSDRTVNLVISNLQFFWIYVLHQPWDKTQVPFRKFDVYLPFVPDRKLVERFLASLDDPKANLAVSILYSTGMRLDELCHLRCSDIYRDAGKIYIQRSKNHSDRYVSLIPSIRDRIVSYWLSLPAGQRPRTWLFTQQRSLDTPMDKQWLQRIILQKKKELGIDGRLCAHSFRHAYATHSYENGMDLITLQSLLGHKSLNSTTIYIHLAHPSRNAIVNPFDQLGGGIHG